jgi:hypothetical protein
MSEPGCGVDAETLRNRLPAGWTIETSCEDGGDGRRVCGYADSAESGGREKAEERGAAFEIWQDGDLWTVIWMCHREPSADCVGLHRVSGVRERCVEWVVEQARDAEEAGGE